MKVERLPLSTVKRTGAGRREQISRMADQSMEVRKKVYLWSRETARETYTRLDFEEKREEDASLCFVPFSLTSEEGDKSMRRVLQIQICYILI